MYNQNCNKHRGLSVSKLERIRNNMLFLCAMSSASGELGSAQDDLSSDDEEYFIPKNLAQMTPRHNDYAVH
jgi:hypothetical protein